jgi:hypothetical protein
MVIKSRPDGKLMSVGFVFHNETDIDTVYGSPNSLGVPQKVSFLLGGGKLIPAVITNGLKEFGDRTAYNSVTRSASSAIRESES